MENSEDASVYLSFVESPIHDDDFVNWKTNKIGGLPIFSPLLEDNQLNYLLNGKIKCRKCNHFCAFIGQIASQIDDQEVDRCLYFFACQRNRCDYFLAIRCVTPLMEENFEQSVEGKSFSANPAKISLYKPYYLGVDDEKDLEKDKEDEKKSSQISVSKEVQIETSGDALEKYENLELETVFKGDKICYRFYKKLREYPDQLIRYSWNGEPLLIENELQLEIKDCETCGSKRVYECQLMPGLINELKAIKKGSKMVFDYGTILIYSCLANCTHSQINIEQCIFLKEPDSDQIEDFLDKN